MYWEFPGLALYLSHTDNLTSRGDLKATAWLTHPRISLPAPAFLSNIANNSPCFVVLCGASSGPKTNGNMLQGKKNN